MPLTLLDVPILSQFLYSVEKSTGLPAMPEENATATVTDATTDAPPKKLPKGVVLGPDGKPCRTCTSSAAWTQMMKKTTKAPAAGSTASASTLSSTTATQQPPSDCPADVEQLGRASWTLLHTMAAQYPDNPSLQQQSDARSFVSSFSKLYPCYWCATDFQAWMKDSKNAPRVSSRQEFGRWMCEAHNEVNVKLGKSVFDCDTIEERWKTGWKDGRCDG